MPVGAELLTSIGIFVEIQRTSTNLRLLATRYVDPSTSTHTVNLTDISGRT